jgi:hypothetical protein
MLPISIQQTLFWGIDKQIEMLEEKINYRTTPDYPEELKPSPSEITTLFIEIEKGLNYMEDYCQVQVDVLRENFNSIKKTSPGRLISVLA